MWTQFWDMHSGGGQKLDWPMIFIEAPEKEARIIFYNRFGRNPDRVTCTCCGEDYSVSEYKTLEAATDFHRREAYRDAEYEKTRKYIPFDSKDSKAISLKQYLATGKVLVIREKEIKANEREGTVPQQGYVWQS